MRPSIESSLNTLGSSGAARRLVCSPFVLHQLLSGGSCTELAHLPGCCTCCTLQPPVLEAFLGSVPGPPASLPCQPCMSLPHFTCSQRRDVLPAGGFSSHATHSHSSAHHSRGLVSQSVRAKGCQHASAAAATSQSVSGHHVDCRRSQPPPLAWEPESSCTAPINIARSVSPGLLLCLALTWGMVALQPAWGCSLQPLQLVLTCAVLELTTSIASAYLPPHWTASN